MNLNLTNLKDLEHICGLAQECYQRREGLELEKTWLERIAKYQALIRAKIAVLEQAAPAWSLAADSMRIDPARMGQFPETGIYVRARGPDNKWQSTDISRLTKESLFLWLRSRGGDNPWAENTVALLLGHQLD